MYCCFPTDSPQVLLAPSMDALRKPDPGMWHFLANRLNSGVTIGAHLLAGGALGGLQNLESQFSLPWTGLRGLVVRPLDRSGNYCWAAHPFLRPALPTVPSPAQLLLTDKSQSFYVGDSDGDSGFASAVGLRCFRPASFFKGALAALGLSASAVLRCRVVNSRTGGWRPALAHVAARDQLPSEDIAPAAAVPSSHSITLPQAAVAAVRRQQD